MATKPTRGQQGAVEILAEVLMRVAGAARLDGKAAFDAADMAEFARLLSRASSAFTPEAIALKALDARGKALGLRAGTAELLTLMDGASPLDALLLDDDAFRERVAKIEEELGDV